MTGPVERRGRAHWRARLALRRASLGCCVRMSNTWHWPSRHVATSLFMAMSRRSNCRPHTPLPTLAAQRTRLVRRSNSFTSPLS